MEYFILFHVLGLVILVNFAMCLEGHAETGKIVPRDTDEESELREKLTRLTNLLSGLEDRDENDLLKIADHKKVQTPDRTSMSEGDMRQVKPIEGLRKPSPASVAQTTQKPVVQKQNRLQLSPQDRSSLEILAKALTKINGPKFSKSDSTGDDLGTDRNEPVSDGEKTREMENMIINGLERLDQDTRDEARSQQSAGNMAPDLYQGSTYKGDQLKDEALSVVESQLMKDVLMAEKMGFSVDDLIRDMDNRVYREERLRKLQEQLDALNLPK